MPPHLIPNDGPFEPGQAVGSDAPGVVLLTGASSGIGWSCCEALLDEGFIVVAGTRKHTDSQKLKHHFQNPNLFPVYLDVTEPDHWEEVFHLVDDLRKEAPLAALINNAGIALGGPVECLDTGAIRDLFEVNFFGPLALIQRCIPRLRTEDPIGFPRSGRIINLSSIAGRNSLPYVAPYSASKYALESLSDALRLELNPWGIQVILIEPGAIQTPIWKKSTDQSKAACAKATDIHREVLYQEVFDSLDSVIESMAKKGLSPDTVARVVVDALLSERPKSRYVIGIDAHLRLLLNWLPTSFRDWLIHRNLNKSLYSAPIIPTPLDRPLSGRKNAF